METLGIFILLLGLISAEVPAAIDDKALHDEYCKRANVFYPIFLQLLIWEKYWLYSKLIENKF
jgi:hypothetical protein